MSNIEIGPAGIGPVKDVEYTFEEFSGLGIHVAEIPFTYGIFIKDKKVAEKIKEAARRFKIGLSIHAPYWINLNSEDLKKVRASKQRILRCCEVGDWIGAEKVVFHCGYFGRRKREQTYKNIRKRIKEIQEDIKKKGWNVKLCPETMGKINVFGSVEEISRLVKDTGCSFCLDFAHILARDKTVDWRKIKRLFPKKEWHCHFSGIEYNDKGERHHVKTEKKYWRWLLKNLPGSKKITIINEAPTPFDDSLLGIEILKNDFTDSN